MKVGGAIIFQNPMNQRSDYDVYRDDLRLGDLYEPLGFDSIWSVEHHFDDYTMCPDVLQFLTYYAGRTKNIQLGSMVVVLPWHDPIRVAEQVSVVDHMSGGRMILGLGRGLARIEYDGFRVNMSEARERFVEYAEMVIEGLEKGYIEYNGKFIQQPKRDIRPKPFKSFKGRTYAAAVSPESSRIMAKLGIGILIIPQKPWDAVEKELNEYRTIYRQVNGGDAPPTIVGGWTYCDANADRAREMAVKYIGGYWQTVLRHYEMAADHFGKAKGYEYYEQMSKMLKGGGADAAVEFFLNLQVWGTPEMCFNKIDDIRKRMGSDAFTGVFS
ncbi:MAG: LLM class flavin-dependent oxidoreductase [Candidatus Binataceae bacterium]